MSEVHFATQAIEVIFLDTLKKNKISKSGQQSRSIEIPERSAVLIMATCIWLILKIICQSLIIKIDLTSQRWIKTVKAWNQYDDDRIDAYRFNLLDQILKG